MLIDFGGPRVEVRDSRMPYRRLATAVLADWLEVEHTLRVVQDDTREAALLRVEAQGLQVEYERLGGAGTAIQAPGAAAIPACGEPVAESKSMPQLEPGID